MALLFTTNAFADGHGSTNQEVKNFIDKLLNTPTDKIKLGHFNVMKNYSIDGANLNAGRMSQAVYKIYRAASDVGIIGISKDQSYQQFKSGNNFNWMAYSSSIQGVSEKIVVTKTTVGEKLATGIPQQNGYLLIRDGVFKVDKIIENKLLKKGIDSYQIVRFTYTAEWYPEIIKFYKLLGKSVSNQRKGIILFKWDPFLSTWKAIAEDRANIDEDFATNNVAKALGE